MPDLIPGQIGDDRLHDIIKEDRPMADPIHPNWDGIAFRATTDQSGVIVTPTSAQTQPPYTYLPLVRAVGVYGDLRAVVHGIEADDPDSYFAVFLNELCDDLAAAIEGCRPKGPVETGELREG